MLCLQQTQHTGPNGVIIVSGSLTMARDCEIGEAAYAEAVLYSEEFKEI